MKIERVALLKACETVKPALAQREVYEEQVHIWSDGKTLTAYNDTSLGISVPFESEIVGGLRGSVLLGVLANSRAKEVEITASEGQARVKAGRTRLNLALLPVERTLWSFPKPGKGKGLQASPAFVGALAQALLSTGKGTAAPEQLGVVLSGAGGQAHMFSTDSETISWKTAKKPDGFPNERAIVPTPFVEQLVRLSGGKGATLYFIKSDDANPMVGTSNSIKSEKLKQPKINGIIGITEKGVNIFARIVDAPKPVPLADICTENMGKSDPVAIPAKLRLALERASVMLAGAGEEFVEVTVDGDRMKIYAKTPFGELSDVIILDKAIPPVSIRLNPDLLKRALPFCATIGFSDHSVILTGERFVYLAATAAGPVQKKS